MPPPWSPKLVIKKDKFNQILPKGEKANFYLKCKVEIFSDFK